MRPEEVRDRATSPTSQLTKWQVMEMTITNLKDALDARDLPVNAMSLKAALQQRLLHHEGIGDAAERDAARREVRDLQSQVTRLERRLFILERREQVLEGQLNDLRRPGETIDLTREDGDGEDDDDGASRGPAHKRTRLVSYPEQEHWTERVTVSFVDE